MTYESGMQIFAASPVSDDTIEAAKQYIRANEYTHEQVKIVKSEKCVAVVWR